MILKIIPHKAPSSFNNLITYIIQEGKGKDGAMPEIVTHNIRGKTKADWVQEYKTNETYRQFKRADDKNIRVYHEVLSFSTLDNEKITPEILNDITRFYIQSRAQDSLVISATHANTDALHIHFAVSGCRLVVGRASRISKTGLLELKLSVEKYVKDNYPQLVNSRCEHGTHKPYPTHKEYQAMLRQERTLHKEVVMETVAECYAKAQSREHFFSLLRENNFQCYDRNGQPQGVMYNEMKFRFSRLGIDINQLPKSPIDMKNEKETLDEINALRGSRQEKTKDNHRTINLTALQLNDVRQELDRLYMDKNGLLIQMTQKGMIDEELSKDLDDIIRREAYLISKENELSLSVEAEKYLPKEEVIVDINQANPDVHQTISFDEFVAELQKPDTAEQEKSQEEIPSEDLAQPTDNNLEEEYSEPAVETISDDIDTEILEDIRELREDEERDRDDMENDV